MSGFGQVPGDLGGAGLGGGVGRLVRPVHLQLAAEQHRAEQLDQPVLVPDPVLAGDGHQQQALPGRAERLGHRQPADQRPAEPGHRGQQRGEPADPAHPPAGPCRSRPSRPRPRCPAPRPRPARPAPCPAAPARPPGRRRATTRERSPNGSASRRPSSTGRVARTNGRSTPMITLSGIGPFVVATRHLRSLVSAAPCSSTAQHSQPAQPPQPGPQPAEQQQQASARSPAAARPRRDRPARARRR